MILPVSITLKAVINSSSVHKDDTVAKKAEYLRAGGKIFSLPEREAVGK